MPTDEQLVRSACRGEPGAFGALVERYQERLLRFLLTRCPSRADAEDVLQDAFVNAYRYLASYDPRWRFSTWLYRIALREAGRRDGQSSADGLDQLAAENEADPLVRVSTDSSRENLWLVARRELSEEAYNAMWLRYVEELSVRDVAATMERSVSWTKVTLMRSRTRLAKAAQDDSDLRGEAYGQP